MLDAAKRSPKLHEQVLRRLEEMILSGAYGPGDPLPSERQLMEFFSVGRPAIREALLSLERAGVVRLRGGSPAVVTRVSPEKVLSELTVSVRSFMADAQGVRELQEARALVECAIARHAARHRTDRDLDRIRASLDANAAALGDLREFERTDVAFHTELVKTVRNRIFDGAQIALSDWLLEQRRTTLAIPSQAERALAFHRDIFAAIEQADADGAEEAMRAHMRQTIEIYWEAADRAP